MSSVNFIEDKDGKASSKRLAGLSLLALGGIMSCVLFASGILNVTVAHAATEAMYCVFITGSGLLGITPLEGIRKK